jgi:hypothetical protein
VAREGIETALSDDDPLQRYWALTVCSAFGERAAALVDRAREMAVGDPHLLVRLRAWEFVGLVGDDPREGLRQLLTEAGTAPEAVAVLNTMSLFRFLHPDWAWDLTPDRLPAEWLGDGEGKASNVARLLEYLG